jgi:hypothetical protein
MQKKSFSHDMLLRFCYTCRPTYLPPDAQAAGLVHHYMRGVVQSAWELVRAVDVGRPGVQGFVEVDDGEEEEKGGAAEGH